jgi:GDPmannose 4,6-dehydratase
VRELVELAFKEIGVTIAWKGQGADEQGYDAKTDTIRVEIDKRYFRPTEVDLLIGDPTKAYQKLGWKHTISFPQLVAEMVASDLVVMKKRGFA